MKTSKVKSISLGKTTFIKRKTITSKFIGIGEDISSWYNKTTGMVTCSDSLIEGNNEVIPCL